MWASAAAGTLKEHSLCLLNPLFMVSLLAHNHILKKIRLFIHTWMFACGSIDNGLRNYVRQMES